jgi:hypothetical protein
MDRISQINKFLLEININPNDLIGLTITQARAKYKKNFRVVCKDGSFLIITRDFCPNRINVSTKKGKIVEIVGIG